MKSRRWFAFSHVVPPRGTQQQTPTIAAHLVSDGTTTPACEYPNATLLTMASEPRGFVLACVACLALSEI